MVATRSNHAAASPADDEGVERAARVREMIERWMGEAVDDEPDWDVEDLAPLSLRGGSSTDSRT